MGLNRLTNFVMLEGAGDGPPVFGWDLDFDGYADGITEDTTSDTQWGTTLTGNGPLSVQAAAYTTPGTTKCLHFEDCQITSQILTETVDISSALLVDVSIMFTSSSGLENTDTLNTYYSLDGGADVLIASWTGDYPELTLTTHSVQGLSGNTLAVKVVVRMGVAGEIIELYKISLINAG